jgi:IS30 family transposase
VFSGRDWAAPHRDKATISRELRRNHAERDYRPKQAQEKAQARVSEAHAGNVRKISDETWVEAKRMLRLDHSAEQVSCRLTLIKGGSVSHETLYQRIYADKS